MDKNYGQLFIKGFVMAIPWAIVFSISLALAVQVIMGMVRQEVKEAIEYTATTAVHRSIRAVAEDPIFHQEILPKVKQNVKEGVEFAVTTAQRKLELGKASGHMTKKAGQ